MLRIIQSKSAASARSYYQTSDYYIDGQERAGTWHGKGAQRLGLSGTIDKQSWEALCDNRDPKTGERLTLRQKTNRRVGYDFNWHSPKSLSLLYSLTGHERLLDAFEESVSETMNEMQTEVETRVRKHGKCHDRVTGNMVWGQFTHMTSRPVDGVPDPHLHVHSFVHNVTWDHEEQRWKALSVASLKRDAPYFEARFQLRLARKLETLGLPVYRTKSGFEIAGFDAPTLKKFSRRTQLIEDKAAEKGVTDAKQKAELGAKTREAKREDLSAPMLEGVWRARMTGRELEELKKVKARIGGPPVLERAGKAHEAALDAVLHCFERQSVVPERVLQARALRHGIGEGASIGSVVQAIKSQRLLYGTREGRRWVTTADVLGEERRMIDFARKGRGALRPLVSTPHRFKRDWLNAGQRAAVSHILASRDRVTLVRGGAGVGKTTLTKEAVEAIETAGKKVFLFAPSAEASRGVLRAEGFEDADTVSRLLVDEKLQKQARGQVLLVDEASLLSTRAMSNLFEVAARIQARVMLLGDAQQHRSVERGDAMRLLESEAGLVPALVTEIQRQKRDDYKEAVRALSGGQVDAGFRELDRLGWIKEVPTAERYRQLADDYVSSVTQGKSTLVVAPTHRELDLVTSRIRSQLKATGKLGKEEHRFATLTNANLTEGERRDPAAYRKGDTLIYHQNSRKHTRGDRVIVAKGKPLPLEEAARFQVFHRGEIDLAAGDVIRITRNGTTKDGAHRLNNGALYSVRGFDRSGNIILNNGWTVAKTWGYLSHGYAVTSYSAQGKTMDRVIIAAGSQSAPAISREQAYVSVSRGREKATIYTDDREALFEAARRTSERMSATEFAAAQVERGQKVQRQEVARQQQSEPEQKAQERELAYER